MKDINEISVSSIIDSAMESIRFHDITMAYEYLWTAKKYEPENAEILNLLALCHFTWGDFEKAEASWKKVMELDAANSEASSFLSDLHSPSFQFWLKKYYEAVNQVENRHYEEAQYLLWNLLKENDGFVGVYQLLGLSCLATSEKNTARKVWQKGLEIDCSNQLLLNYLELVIPDTAPRIGGKEPEPTRFSWQQLLSKKMLAWGVAGVLCLALILQSGIFFLAKQDKEALIHDMQTQIALLNQNIARSTSNTPVFAQYNEAGLVGSSAKNNEEIAAGGADIDDSKESHYYMEGYNAYLCGNLQKAYSNLGMVVEMNTHSYRNREALYYLALLHYLANDYDNAENKFVKYLDDYPDTNYFDESLYYLGCIYQAKGQNDKALQFYTKLQEVAPHSGYLTASAVKNVIQANNKQ
ncbi:MAG: tetratricopeptide repeat protein [Syntrophomonadaceae bacterium]|nr:tetratricopeptide repeat protein [Syntrophomonadaceae bacterium]